jgi:repressor LexA
MKFGTIIRRRRSDLGLTQDEVAQRAGISKPYVSNIETGKAKNPPSDTVLRSLAEALEMDSSELIQAAQIQRTPKDVRRRHVALEAELSKLREVVRELLRARPLDEIDAPLPEAPDDLLRESSDVESLYVGPAVPVINHVAAGYPQDFTDLDYPAGVADEYVRCPDVRDPQAFAARVCGDSMEPKYHEGDIVVFSPNTPAKPGDDCFVRFGEGEGTTFKRFYPDDENSIRLQPLNDAHRPQIHNVTNITGLWPAVYRIERIRR